MYAVAMVVLLGFGSLALDLGMLRMAAADAQDVADAASQAALLELREAGSVADATAIAQLVVAKNEMLGATPVLQKIEFGTWDDGVFVPDNTRPNGVQVTVGRTVDTALAKMIGVPPVPVSRRATSAARLVHIVLVMDITNSWSQANFANARAAAVQFFDMISSAAGPEDRIGMVVFTGRYGVEQTPLMRVDDAVAAGVREEWDALRTASKAGTKKANGDCSVYTGAKTNDFSVPYGGCYPNMWREYIDESGTDHANGLEMALQMFAEHDEPGVYRALLLLTDGIPNGTGAHKQRDAAGFVDDRWRFYRTTKARTTAQVQSDSISLAQKLWDDQEVNLWAVSFIQDAKFLKSAIHGDGYYVLTNSSSALVPIFQDVAESIPASIVE